jgi:leader peptidase (prepilin peptidase)/N-methyltransferase
LLVSDLPPWLITAFAFVFGAAWGSFFNVAIYRWPRGMSVVSPPSHCPTCRAKIPGYRNLPIVGYLILRGKTACCGTTLSPRYPMVETLTAVLAVAVAHRFVLGPEEEMTLTHAAAVGLCYFIFVGGLLIATFVDLERMEIPDEVSLPGAALGLVTAAYRAEPGVEAAALGAGGAFLVIQVLFVWGYENVFGRRGMGEGDSKFMLFIGAFIGWRGAAFALFAGAAQGIVVAVYGLISGKQLGPDLDALDDEDDDEDDGGDRDDESEGEGGDGERDDDLYDSEPPPAWAGHVKLPFGPFLALGALEYLFFGDALIDAWFGLVASLLPA